jgi:sensor histidine kinase YesM
MMHSSVKPNDNWFRFLGIPFIAIMSHVIFFNENHGQADEKFSYWQVWIISIFEAIFLWECNRMVLLFFRSRYPLLEQTAQRITYQIAACIVATILIRYINIYFYDKTQFWGYIFPVEGYVYNIFVALLYVAIVGSLYEGFYYFQSWKEMFQEKELLKREYLQTQLSSLKEQINPHFLFNNFSSLASLVMEDQQKAVKFIDELSSVYRYLLQTNNEPFVTLQEELTFIEHYFHLLKTRFGQGIELDVSVPEHMLNSQLPPLTLQLLIENAVKHNAVLEEAPLKIDIHVTDDQVIVENAIRHKSTPAFSSKTGLNNIRQKYKLLGGKQVHVAETGNTFRVSIPLFKEPQYEAAGSRR